MKRIKSISKSITYLSLLILSAIIIKKYILASNIYKIDEIIINGNDFLNDEIIKKNIEPYTINKNAFDINIKSIKKLIEKDDYIYSCQVFRKLPSTIFLNIKEIQPLALFTINDKIYFLNQNMEKIKADINAINHFSDYPVITNLSQNNFNLNKAKYILNRIINNSNNIYKELSEVRFMDSDIILILNNNTKIIIDNNNYENNLKKLFEFNNQIMSKNNFYFEKYHYINMKIPNQIITNEKEIKI